jgi:hypothetical protein
MKSAFLLTQLVTSSPTLLPRFLANDLLPPLVAMADDPNDDAREKAVALLSRVTQDETVRTRCAELGLAGVLRERAKKCEEEEKEGKRSREEASEAIAVLKGLLDTL